MNHLDELPRIRQIAAEYGVDPLFIMAIREQESGRAGREFGVLSTAAPTWDAQCAVCCASVRNRLSLWASPVFALSQGPSVKRLRYSDSFIETFASRWAPVGADNDPENLNANWAAGVIHIYVDLIAIDGAPVAVKA